MSDLREGFEAWALSRGLSTIRYAIGDTQGVGDYQDDYTSDAWAAWQASRQRDGTAEIAGTVAGLKALDDEHLRSPFNACSLKSRCIQTADALDRQRDGHAEFVRVYNSGYAAGHHDTVEGQYTHILPVDMDTYHAGVVGELLAELAKDQP